MDLNKNLTQRSANRKRKSSLANVLIPLHSLKKPGLAPLDEAEDLSKQDLDLTFEPTTLPDTTLVDLFNNHSLPNELNDSEETDSALTFPIFTKQFVEFHKNKESDYKKLSASVNRSRSQTRVLSIKNAEAVQQGHHAERMCRELRANNAQIKDYLSNFRTELKPLLSQLEAGLGCQFPADQPQSTQDLVTYLKDLGRRIWDAFPDEDAPSQP